MNFLSRTLVSLGFVLSVASAGPFAALIACNPSPGGAPAENATNAASDDDASAPSAKGTGKGKGEFALSDSPDERECKDLLARIEAKAGTIWAHADKSCKSDEDCTLAGARRGCYIGCGDAIAKTAVEGLKSEQAPFAAVCDEFRSGTGKCFRVAPIPTPSCPRLVPACEKGQCTTQ